MPRGETAFLASHLFGGEEGRRTARRIDRRIDRLPGLASLHLLEGELERNGSTKSQSWPLRPERPLGLELMKERLVA
jgi:hypothetical protein